MELILRRCLLVVPLPAAAAVTGWYYGRGAGLMMAGVLLWPLCSAVRRWW